jgi:spore coat polysaccharide biosynthesis protein SpsF
VRVVAVVQARTGSTRLPGKVLLPLGGRPALERMLERVRAACQLDDVIVATTVLAADDSIRAVANAMGVACMSGHPTDLLQRHVDAARLTEADAVVKIPSDCPLIDPRVIDEVVGFYRRNRQRFDFVSNLHPPTWPDGNDVEVMRRDLLELAAREAAQPVEREHTTPFFWDQPERFRVGNVTALSWESGHDLSSAYRLTLDYGEDHALIAAVWDALHVRGAAPFSVEAIVEFLDAHPEIKAINARFAGRSWMTDDPHALRTLRRAAQSTASLAETP